MAVLATKGLRVVSQCTYIYYFFMKSASIPYTYYRDEYCPGLVNNPGVIDNLGVVAIDLTKESSCHSE